MPNEVKLLPCDLDSATVEQIERANEAVGYNMNDDFTPKWDSAQGYACALTAIMLTDATRPTIVTDEVVEPNAALLDEKDRLDRISLEQSFTTDPVERLVGEALTAAGFEWRHEGHPLRRDDPVTLDFEVVGGPHVEVKRFHTARCQTQLAQVENVILIQGIAAAKWFASAIAAMPAIVGGECWQPIESAPEGEILAGLWVGSMWIQRVILWPNDDDKPMYWRSLPAPPSQPKPTSHD